MALILIIEDDDQFRSMLKQMLGRAGHEVMDAPDGKEGLRMYRERPADLIITDIIMPEKEGLETIHALRKDYPDIKVIAISGGGAMGTELYLDMAKGLGASRAFSKPIDRGKLLSAINDLLG